MSHRDRRIHYSSIFSRSLHPRTSRDNFNPVFRQFVRNGANAVLGGFRAGGPREFRAGRHQSVHQVLGHADVRHVLGDQHRRPIKSANRHDEPFLSVDIRELTSARP